MVVSDWAHVSQAYLRRNLAKEGHERQQRDSGVHRGHDNCIVRLVECYISDAGPVGGPVELEPQGPLGEASIATGEENWAGRP